MAAINRTIAPAAALALAAAGAIIGVFVPGPPDDQVQFSPKELEGLARGQELHAEAGVPVCLTWETFDTSTGQYVSHTRRVKPGFSGSDLGQPTLSSIRRIPNSECNPTSDVEEAAGPGVDTVTAGVATCTRQTEPFDVIQIRDRFPAGFDCVPSGATAQCPVRVLAGKDNCPYLIAEARGELPVEP